MSKKEISLSLNKETLNRSRKFKLKNSLIDLIIKKIKYTKKVIIQFFIDYTNLYIRKAHLINQIIQRRKENVTFIQECFRQYLLRKSLVSFAKRHTKYYSVYPSRTDFNKISIKLYTNLKDPSQFVELPVRFCNKRNCFIFDIPKAKFPSKKKFMCFTFVLDDSTIVDSKYNCIFFGGRYVNQIDFNSIEKKEIKQQKLFKSYMHLYKKILFKKENDSKINNIPKESKIIDISNSNKDEILKSPLTLKNNGNNNINNLSLSCSEKLSNDGKYFRSLTLRNSKSNYNNNLNNSTLTEPINLDSSISEEIGRSKKKKRNKSILKEHKNQLNKSSHSSKDLDFKKVSFGWVETSE